ncbi:MAG: restriction endonuclease [Acidobacteriota bacterium]
MEILLGIALFLALFLACLAGIHGWFSDKSTRLKENQYNRELKAKLETATREFDQEVKARLAEFSRRTQYLDERDAAFKQGYLCGRHWLAEYIGDADRSYDESLVRVLRTKKRPALKAADQVAEARQERREYKKKVKFLEYQLKSYIEYFPILQEYEDAILSEALQLNPKEDSPNSLESTDPVLKFVSKKEYENLDTIARNQLALDRFLKKHHTQAGIGRFYERYLGYRYESDGWEVEYIGIFKGMEDMGRDLICRRGNEVRIIQAKCWSVEKLIHEKHIFQLFGTVQLYLMEQSNNGLFKPTVKPIFITTTTLSDVARKVAAWLNIAVQEKFVLDKSYAKIKCNINQSTGERIYHLPMDQQYDKVKIIPGLGECYVISVSEAESLGFRRAYRYRPNAQV